MVIGRQGSPLDLERLARVQPSALMVHVCGAVDPVSWRETTVERIPAASTAEFGRMTVTTDFVGPRPLIDLHTAGLAVGERMARLRSEVDEVDSVTARVIATCPFAQGFPTTGGPSTQP